MVIRPACKGNGCDRHSNNAQHAQPWARLERPDEYQEFGRESAETRQSERREPRDDEEDRESRHDPGYSPKFGYFSSVSSVVEDSNHREQERRHDAVGEHLEYGAIKPYHGEAADAHEHVAHMTHARIPDNELQVSLGHRRKRAV